MVTEGGINWYDHEGNMLSEDDEFVRGELYKVEIKLVPKKEDDTNKSKFVSPVSAYINDEKVTEQSDWMRFIHQAASCTFIILSQRVPTQRNRIIPT